MENQNYVKTGIFSQYKIFDEIDFVLTFCNSGMNNCRDFF